MADRRERRPLKRLQMGAAGIGFEFAIVLVGASLFGLWIDRRYGTAPWGVLIGALLGLAGGLANFLRAASAAIRANREPSAERDERE